MDVDSQPFDYAAVASHVDADEDALEDLGFFGFGKTNDREDAAQRALNELGLLPSSPLGRRHESSHEMAFDGVGVLQGSGDHFDLEHELRMEEDQRREEAQLPTPYFDEADGHSNDDEDNLESNGILDADSSPLPTPPSTSATISLPRLAAYTEEDGPRAHASASTTPSRLPGARNEDSNEYEDENVGMNGLPKYLPVGLTSVILLDGSTVRFERRKRVSAWRPKPAHYGAGPTGLLSRPVHRIIEDVEAMAALQIVQQNEAADAAFERRFASSDSKGKEKLSPAMWQERYRPARFSELIGEERTHRDVLSWIKSWDKCVYGKKAASMRKRMRDEELAIKAAQTSAFSGPPVYKDKWDRPKERILLLGGPAGMGKTTLAHVAAKTCGYLVHEINASDDRSARTVEERVREALESNSLHAKKSKQPTCLILDEVDGATGGGSGGDFQGGQNGGGGFIRALIKLVEHGNSNQGSSSSSDGRGKRNGKQKRALLRPIICVCNDPYAPALRALRPYSKLVRLNRPTTAALMARLRQICEREDIHHDTAGLNMLIGLCQGDVRSCLNALQLVQSDPRGVTLATMQGGGSSGGLSIPSVLSIKDGSSNIHQVWQRLLRTQTSRERDRQRGSRMRAKNENEGEDQTSESHDIVASVISSGEMDKVLAGCFEHYPKLKLVDDGWWRFRRAHDWIHWFEYLNNRGWEMGMHTEMWAYLPWSFVCWRQLFANTANELPEYPRVDYQNHLMRIAFDEMSHDVQSNLPVHTRCQFDKIALTTELGPMLLPLMTPELKPINSQLVRAEEKETLTACVALMHSLNVDFVLDKNAQGHSYYRFDPPLEAFAHFEGKRVEGHSGHAARFNVRQLISTELHAMRVRNAQQQRKSLMSEGDKPKKGGDRDDDLTPQPKKAEAKGTKKGAVDFFGRPVVVKANKTDERALPALPASILARRQEKENQGLSIVSSAVGNEQPDDEPNAKKAKLKVFYHFHEGYSNAVRKPIKISSFFS